MRSPWWAVCPTGDATSPGRESGAVDAPDTVVDAIRLLQEEGYRTEFRIVDGRLRWEGDDDHGCHCGDAVVERLHRFEGPSDPGDEMVVFGLRDPGTGRRGHLASAYGADADPAVMEHLATLARRHSAG